MRVGVDARSLAGNRGVAHYTAALLDALTHGYPQDEWVLFGSGSPSAVATRLAARPNVSLRAHRIPARVLFGVAALCGRPRLDRMLGPGLDVLWMPAPRPVGLGRETPLVLTVHDLAFQERPSDFSAYERVWHVLGRPRRQVERAHQLLVVSGATRDALAARWQVPPAAMTVVPLGVSPPGPAPSGQDLARVRARHGVGERYLLAVGALEPRKAPELLVRAFTEARAAGLSAELVFAGEGRLARRLHAPGVRLLGHVTDADLHALYSAARALVMPSRLEGFGLPPLEALVRGTPAVVGDLPVYDETLGEGALRVPDGDEWAWAQALARIDADEPLRHRLLAAAQRPLRRLTWERAADRTHAVLGQVAANATGGQ